MNEQKPLELENTKDGQTLSIFKIFPTIQGEGPFSGHRAVFIRLEGCNLQCPQCDTIYVKKSDPTKIKHILQIVQELQPNGLVVITGGEPFRQNLTPLIQTLLDANYFVQIETNGTLPPSPGISYKRHPQFKQGAYIVCSPKAAKINPKLEDYLCAYKYVLSASDYSKRDGLPNSVLGMPCVVARPKRPGIPIYIQPADEQDAQTNQLNINVCIESCMQFGYILQVQTHKLIGVE